MINSRPPLLAAALTALLAAAFVGGAATPPVATAAGVQEFDMELGKEVYRSQCEPCHGSQGKGDGPAARFLETTPRDLTAGRWLYVEEATVEQVAELVKDGIADTEMEPFSELLLEDEMTAVAAFVIAEFADQER